MERPITIYTGYEEYYSKYNGKYFDYFQIHIYSISQIISTYYDPKLTTIPTVKNAAETILKEIQKRSNRGKRISLFEKNGKFLITEDSELIDQGEPLYFNPETVSYEYMEETISIDDLLNGIKIDDFIRNSLITVGAEDLYEIIAPFAKKMCENNDAWETENEKLRELNKKDPKFTLEFYTIEKNYKPVLKESIPIHSEEAIYLPEYLKIIQSQNRITYLIRDNNTNKIVDGSIEDAIEGIKHTKWMKRNPSVIDLDELQRMEMGIDNPDTLGYDNHDDELEEGDEDYTPGF
jgi:hypothetical protein